MGVPGEPTSLAHKVAACACQHAAVVHTIFGNNFLLEVNSALRQLTYSRPGRGLTFECPVSCRLLPESLSFKLLLAAQAEVIMIMRPRDGTHKYRTATLAIESKARLYAL